jgi:hypothetical protein
MPKKILAANVIVCQLVLDQKDDVMSAIRIIDMIWAHVRPDVPIEEQGVMVNALVQVKSYIGDMEEHHVRLELVRPDGEITELFDKTVPVTSRLPGTPGGMNLVLQVVVVPRQMGTHYLTLTVDGKEETRAPFTLREPEPEKT